jgi:hypothetical protein
MNDVLREFYAARIVSAALVEGWIQDRVRLLSVQYPKLSVEGLFAMAAEQVEAEGAEIADRKLKEKNEQGGFFES